MRVKKDVLSSESELILPEFWGKTRWFCKENLKESVNKTEI
ncbi:hypothetical protein CKA32_006458 [Geitlerinema sp. FC II]|nr:hypothetical protein CKA32_006458 [Geitlerinema sp. FC II]